MEFLIEKIIKFTLVFILLAAGLLYWLLPKTKIVKKIKMNESLFILTNIIGIICGATGLLVTFIWPKYVIELHLWELIVIPFALVYIYWGVIVRKLKTKDIIDEKQDFDMTKAGAFTMAFSIFAMTILFVLYSDQIIEGLIWYPYFFFSTILVFSSGTLYFFKRV
jgi:hypothetical protein